MNHARLVKAVLGMLMVSVWHPSVAESAWTIMVFMNGKNSLDGSIVANFEQLASVDQSENVNILVELGRPETKPTSATSSEWGGVRRFKVKKGLSISSNPVMDLGSSGPSTDMGLPETLESFMQWSIDNFKARHYALIIASHGQGFRLQLDSNSLVDAPKVRPSINALLTAPESGGFRSVSQDDNTTHVLFNQQIQSVLETLVAKGIKLDLLGFDACSMAMLETAYAMRHGAGLMVASEELIPDRGWNYADWLRSFIQRVDADVSSHADEIPEALTLGSFIVSTYKAQEAKYETARGDTHRKTLSVVDLSKIEALAQEVAQLASAMEVHLDSNRSAIKEARQSNMWFGMPAKADVSVDLPYLMTRLASETGNASEIYSRALAVRETVQKAVVLDNFASETVKAVNLGGGGIAIFFPPTFEDFWSDPDHSGYVRGNKTAPVEFVETNEWALFLKRYLQ